MKTLTLTAEQLAKLQAQSQQFKQHIEELTRKMAAAKARAKEAKAAAKAAKAAAKQARKVYKKWKEQLAKAEARLEEIQATLKKCQPKATPQKARPAAPIPAKQMAPKKTITSPPQPKETPTEKVSLKTAEKKAPARFNRPKAAPMAPAAPAPSVPASVITKETPAPPA
ncbi:hypothetical protein NXS98_07025 [Fontisphaera persica]|uniref:hypothetical protein n=1 Tax=Fontisphaera persica TaxID=2974023 RepID=UPI0024BFCB0D|nr:hypothetical protein [Fontisphaera persica]WCJ60874.1 hypothetical protein NXS98_07025 [Fontisphaera persica]